MAVTAIRNMTSEEDSLLEKYKILKNEKTNAKAFLMLLSDFFILQNEIAEMKKKLSSAKLEIYQLKEKYEEYDEFFHGLQKIFKNKSK